MRFSQIFLVALPLLALVKARDASASGGYFPDSAQQGQTQVAGHRILLSISEKKTALWDQITYTGDPASFAWVLPIKGKAEVGVSSDALFNRIDQLTQVTVVPAPLLCMPPVECEGELPYAFLPYAYPVTDDVSVIAREAVGPYDTVQLSSQDPIALKTWLSDHNFAIPDDISSVIDAYVAEGFNFVAIKLLPGQGIKSMKPVRVITQGANPVLPLRMMDAGAGATVPITLWVVGRDFDYKPSNFPWFAVTQDQLVWDWDKNESNYSTVRQDGFTRASDKGWLIESVGLLYRDQLASLLDLALKSPEQSGYGDGMTISPLEASGADIDGLVPVELIGIHYTRLHAELSREALTTDLTLEGVAGAYDYQTMYPPQLRVEKSVGHVPACPVDQPCRDMDGSAGCDCTTSGESDASTAPFGALLSLGWILARRRKAGRAAA
jgi:MYXO-CTERM domain-containing protein